MGDATVRNVVIEEKMVDLGYHRDEHQSGTYTNTHSSDRRQSLFTVSNRSAHNVGPQTHTCTLLRRMTVISFFVAHFCWLLHVHVGLFPTC